MVNIPSRNQTAGIPSQWSEDITAVDIALITGNEPAVMTRDHLVDASQTIPALTPVGLSNGRLVPAVSGVTQAIGILVIAVSTSASTTYQGAPVYRAGCFNPDAINWPASYDTEAEKFSAFDGAPTPTNIIIRRPKTQTVS